MIPCLDPHIYTLPQIVEEVPWTGGWFKRNQFLVISAAEQPHIPKGHTGRLRWLVPGTVHSTALLDHEDSCGKRAFEILISAKRVLVEPGMHVADLYIYATPGSAPRPGVYRNRASIVPINPEW